jgi:hypothetical protein
MVRLNYQYPLNIQKYSLKHTVLNGSDIVLSAQTGSGKTLAFALPILNKMLKDNNYTKTQFDSIDEYRNALKPNIKVSALIICPSRELVEQIHDHFQQLILVKVLKNKKIIDKKIIDKKIIDAKKKLKADKNKNKNNLKSNKNDNDKKENDDDKIESNDNIENNNDEIDNENDENSISNNNSKSNLKAKKSKSKDRLNSIKKQ